jgi:glycosyl transferase family 87
MGEASELMKEAAPHSSATRAPGERLLGAAPWLCRPEFLAVLYAALALASAIPVLFHPGFGNFDIFRHSFVHLVDGNDLYVHYPAEPGDLFKYSPTFALAMAPFWLLPKWLGLPVWNLLNALAPLVAVNRLALSREARGFILLFSALELFISLQNLQSNGLVAALMIGTFAALERDRPILAALLAGLAFHIKIFGMAVAVLFVLYRQRMTVLVAAATITAALGLLPAAVTGFDGLVAQYRSWLELVGHDQIPNNLSLMGFLDTWFGLKLANLSLQFAGIAILLAPLFQRRRWSDFDWRLTYLASVLMWVVVFNHKTESPTFVIAMFGASLWAVVEPPSLARSLLIGFAFVGTSLSSTDFVPRALRQQIVRPLAIKAVPILFLWALTLWRLLVRMPDGELPRSPPREAANPAPIPGAMSD